MCLGLHLIYLFCLFCLTFWITVFYAQLIRVHGITVILGLWDLWGNPYRYIFFFFNMQGLNPNCCNKCIICFILPLIRFCSIGSCIEICALLTILFFLLLLFSLMLTEFLLWVNAGPDSGLVAGNIGMVVSLSLSVT